jgi:DNA polymerase-3 subunit delta
MIYLLFGEDTFRSRSKLAEIVKEHQKVRHGGLNLFRFDFNDFSMTQASQADEFERFKVGLETASMFPEKKFFILENVFSDGGLSKKFLEYLKSKTHLLNSHILVFFEAGKPDLDNPLFVFLSKCAKTQEFKLLGSQSLHNLIRQQAKDLGSEVSSQAIEKLITFFGHDLWALSNELRRLADFTGQGRIEASNIEVPSEFDFQTNIFKTIDAVASGNKKQALGLINQHLKLGEQPLYLLKMLVYQFRNLVMVKGLLEAKKTYPVILKETGLHHFVVQKSCYLCQKLSFAQLKKIYSGILSMETKIKTGKISARQGLELLIIQL